ncbi:MAG: hypothetical protein ACLFNK_04370 [Candidatus Woesearchaeota archaeon]
MFAEIYEKILGHKHEVRDIIEDVGPDEYDYMDEKPNEKPEIHQNS